MNKENKGRSMSWYFDRGLERNALLLDASNLDWFTFPLFDNVRKEIYRTLEEQSEDMDWGYSYPGGKKKLRELIATHESFIEKTEIEPEDVIVGGNGVTGVLNFISQYLKKESLLLDKEDILYPVPAYAGLMKSLEYYNLNPVIIKCKRENRYCLTYDDVKENYSDKTLAIIITNPGNPACCYITKEELTKIFDFAIEKDMYIILDAIFEESPNGAGKFVKSFLKTGNYKKLIKIKGFSKDIPQLSDLRLGWSITKSKKFNNEMLYLGEITNYSNSTFLEALGIVEMQHRVWMDQRVENESMAQYKKDLKFYHNKINNGIQNVLDFVRKSRIFDDYIEPEAGNVLFIKVNEDLCRRKGIHDSHDLFVYILEKANILVTPGHVFGMDIKELWFRITVSRSAEQLLYGMSTIEKILTDN